MCKLTEEIVQPFLDEVIKLSETKWTGSKYDIIKKAPVSTKGKFGEKVTSAYLNCINYKSKISEFLLWKILKQFLLTIILVEMRKLSASPENSAQTLNSSMNLQ